MNEYATALSNIGPIIYFLAVTAATIVTLLSLIGWVGEAIREFIRKGKP